MHASGNRSTFVRIALATFAILMLELALIRWTSQQVRIFAYFNNLTLIAAFLGMGLGVALGERRPDLQHWTLPILFGVSAILGFSETLGILHVRFPDASLVLWGGERWMNARALLTSLAIVLFIFGLILCVFICAGSVVGDLFTRLPPLHAYSADLIGSFIGVLTMTAAAAFGTPPTLWLALATTPFLYFSRRLASIVSFAGILAVSWHSIGAAKYSPYYRIDITRATEFAGRPIQVSVNRDFHQYMLASIRLESAHPTEARRTPVAGASSS